MITECGAAWHVNIPSGASQLDIQQGFLNDVFQNDTFFESFPRIKAIMLFEHEKLVNMFGSAVQFR